MHKFRRRAKYAAWYEDEPYSFAPQYRRLIHRAANLADDSADSKAADRSEHPKADQRLGPKEGNFVETSDSVDVESTVRTAKPLRYRLLGLLPWVVDRWFPSASVTKRQNAAADARAALAKANNVFKARVRPQAVLAELTFVKVHSDSTTSAQTLEEAQVAISSVQSASDIDLESIRVRI